MALSPLGHDVDVVAAAHDLVFLQLEPVVADAAAGGQLVFVAVPRADEVHFVGKRLALVGPIGADQIDHLVDQDAFAGRTAGMDAVIAIGVIGAAVMEHADLILAGDHDAPVAVRQIGRLGHEPFRHSIALPAVPALRVCRHYGAMRPQQQAGGRAKTPGVIAWRRRSSASFSRIANTCNLTYAWRNKWGGPMAESEAEPKLLLPFLQPFYHTVIPL